MANSVVHQTPRLTTRQAAALDYLRAYYRERGVPPTIGEIRDHCGISSTSVVDYVLKGLRRAGMVKDVGRERGASRSYVPVMADGSCPLCGCGGQHGA